MEDKTESVSFNKRSGGSYKFLCVLLVQIKGGVVDVEEGNFSFVPFSKSIIFVTASSRTREDDQYYSSSSENYWTKRHYQQTLGLVIVRNVTIAWLPCITAVQLQLLVYDITSMESFVFSKLRTGFLNCKDKQIQL